jgi:5-methylcytosine-specific restriction endonuclease McrA
MRAYSLTHLTDAALLRELAALVARDRATTAALLAHIAEVDVRRLYLPAGYESMHAYCVDELHLSEDAAYKRIQAARSARQFPALFAAVAEGRLNLTAVCLLAPHLTGENTEGLLAASVNLRNTGIREMLARRFPGDRESFAAPISSPGPPGGRIQLAAQQVEAAAPEGPNEPAQAPVDSNASCPESQERILLQLRVRTGTHEKLRYAQALLSHSVPSGDEAEVLDRALDALIARCERQKFGATARPRTPRNRSTGGRRLVPAHVKRAVWERDEGRCTFVGDTGHRCGTRKFLEFDHSEPVARGGLATVELMRLRCRAHNQYEAERVFGAEFMEVRRNDARHRAAEARATAAAASERTRDVIAALRQLGCRVDEARRAAEHAASGGDDGTLEVHLRTALKVLRPPRSTVVTRAHDLNRGTVPVPSPVSVGA